MRIATYRFNGERKVGLVSDNGTTITPFNMAGPGAARGAMSIIETLAQGQPSTMAGVSALVIADVQLEAPLPAPPRHLCVVVRKYPPPSPDRPGQSDGRAVGKRGAPTVASGGGPGRKNK